VSRTFVAMVITLVATAVFGALPVLFGSPAWPVTPGAVIVAYAALTLPPVEAAVTAALVGLVVDALSGSPIGVSSFALVVTLLLSRLGVSLVTQPRGFTSFVFVFAFAFTHAFFAQTLLALFGQRRAVDLVVVVVVGILDAVLSLLLFPVVHRVLVLLRLEDRGATLGERLSAR
jgi:rod shape-determining protein MreD